MEIFEFAPPPDDAFRFSPVIDGETYEAAVEWSIFGRRWFLRLSEPGGALALYTAVVESPVLARVDSLRWDQARGRVILTAEHALPIGAVVQMTVRGSLPETYNGNFDMAVESPNTLSYPMKTDPGGLVTPGLWGREIDLLQGRFTTTLIYRQRRFETYP